MHVERCTLNVEKFEIFYYIYKSMRAVLFTSLSLFVLIGRAQVPLTCLLTIEQEVTDAERFEFWLESEGKKQPSFSYASFQESRKRGYYMNTNLYAYTDREVPRKNYEMNVKLVTKDTIYLLKYNINITDRVTGLSIIALIGQNSNAKGFLKDVRIKVSMEALKDSLYLKPIGKIKLNTAPRFQIVNRTGSTLYSNTDKDFFFGDLSLKNKKGEWKTYSYILPYQKFNCPDTKQEYYQNNLITYAVVTEDDACTKTIVIEKGEYKFSIEIDTGKEDVPYPKENLKTSTTRLRVFRSFDLELEFKVKK